MVLSSGGERGNLLLIVILCIDSVISNGTLLTVYNIKQVNIEWKGILAPFSLQHPPSAVVGKRRILLEFVIWNGLSQGSESRGFKSSSTTY